MRGVDPVAAQRAQQAAPAARAGALQGLVTSVNPARGSTIIPTNTRLSDGDDPARLLRAQQILGVGGERWHDVPLPTLVGA